jgi:hypothetical protein
MRRAVLLVLALCALGSLAAASPAAAQPAAEKSAEGESARAMDVLNLIVPVVRNGRLVNYLFVNARIQLSTGVDPFRTREKGHFLRDALLKAVHRRSIADATRDDQIDRAAAQALILEVARQQLGANVARSVEILGVSSLRSGGTARS